MYIHCFVFQLEEHIRSGSYRDVSKLLGGLVGDSAVLKNVEKQVMMLKYLVQLTIIYSQMCSN